MSNSRHSISYSASMFAIAASTSAFIVCRSFNVSTNEDGLRTYSLFRSRNLSTPYLVLHAALGTLLLTLLLTLLVPTVCCHYFITGAKAPFQSTDFPIFIPP